MADDDTTQVVEEAPKAKTLKEESLWPGQKDDSYNPREDFGPTRPEDEEGFGK